MCFGKAPNGLIRLPPKVNRSHAGRTRKDICKDDRQLVAEIGVKQQLHVLPGIE